MRILLIHQYFLEKNGAGGTRFNEMTKVWHEEGHDITVLGGMFPGTGMKKSPQYKGKLFARVDHDGVEVIRCHVSESYNVNFLGRLWGYFSFVFSSIWAGLFKTKGKYDIILVTSPPLFLGITAYILSVFKRTPYVFEVRDLWPESAIDTGVVTNKWIIKFAYWFEKFTYNKAVKINVLTPAFRKALLEDKNVLASKIFFIPNAADFSMAEKLNENGFNPEEFRVKNNWGNNIVITYVGAHGVANHLIQIIDAAEVLQSQNKKVKFVLIGDGMKKKSLMNEVQKRNLSNVEFHDFMPKQEVFKFVMASDFGTSVLKKVDTFKTIYSNKTFDYMSCKKPILLAIDGVSRELVETAKCGLYIEPEDTAEWVRIVTKAIEIPINERNKMGQNGYDYAKLHFDRKKLALEYLEYLKQAIN